MDRQPVLEGDRLRLRPLVEADREPLYALAGDREVWAMHPSSDRWRRDVFDAFFDDGLAQGGALVFVEKATGDTVGSSRFGPRDPDRPGAIEIGWTFLGRRYWGSGHNTEAKRLMVGHALQTMERVEFKVGQDNLISRRAVEKIGGVLTGETLNFGTPEAPIPYVVYEITRAGFAGGPLAPA